MSNEIEKVEEAQEDPDETRCERLAGAIALALAEYGKKMARALLPRVPESEIAAYASTFLFAGSCTSDKEMIMRIVKAGGLHLWNPLPTTVEQLDELAEIVASREN